MGDYSTFAIIMAFLLTLAAGLSTGIGSAIAFFTRRSNATFLSVALGFSAGVMVYLSFVEIFPKAQASLAVNMGEFESYLWTTVAFFAGIFITMGIDRLVPDVTNPHEARDASELKDAPTPEEIDAHEVKTLKRMGLFTALAIGLHNFPEGLATFLGALEDPTLGISIAVAVAIHNIPEGVAVSVPIFYSTGSRKKAFVYSFLSGMSEPLGALIGFFILYAFLTESTFGLVFAAVGGVMIYIALDELLPTAEKYGRHHLVIYGVIAGMVLMAISLLLFA